MMHFVSVSPDPAGSGLRENSSRNLKMGSSGHSQQEGQSWVDGRMDGEREREREREHFNLKTLFYKRERGWIGG